MAMSTTRKRAFGATFRTLHDITNNGHSPSGSSGDDDVAGTAKGAIAVRHIPSLPHEKEAAAILRRIHSEFRVLIDRRSWHVSSITEMCCCGDGVDCLRKRKTRVMPNNVLGYNLSRGKAHEIHLRLRHPRTHVLFDYESVAGTMCHELAHCVRGPHDAKFYAAMEDIERQYAVYLAKGVVLDKDGFPVGSSQAHVLGRNNGGATGGKEKGAPADRRRALAAAESRRMKGGLSLGYTLGCRSALCIPKDPREAARIAAERRLIDAQFCLPCDEVIEILGDDSSDEESNDEVEVVEADAGAVAQKAKPAEEGKAQHDSTVSGGVVDLTALDDSFMTSPATPKLTAKSKGGNDQKHGACSGVNTAEWTCPRCTLSNSKESLVCDACHLERPCTETVLECAQKLKAEDDIDFVKAREVAQSRDAFGGFNIYGDKKNPSSTMNHLT